MYNVVDLFSGCGGLSYGFHKNSNFEIIAANEVEKNIAEAYSLNYPDVKMINCSISDLTEEKIKSEIKDTKIDVIIGGPPCQSFSTLGKRQLDDRANLFVEYKRILNILQPAAFIFENVEGLLSMNKGKLFPKIQEEFQQVGYKLKYKILDAADYGVPQHRKRVLLVGFKEYNPFEYPKPSYGDGLLPYITLKDAIGDLPPIKSGQSSTEYYSSPYNDFLFFVRDSDILTEHKAPKSKPNVIKIMECLKDGEGKESLPPEIRPKGGFANTYAKLWWNKPSTTITRNFACPSSSRCIHPRDSRALTIREGARLQSFPDSYKFFGSQQDKRLEIGNAVPPILSSKIADSLKTALDIWTSQPLNLP